MGLNPLDWYGGQFLAFYGLLFVAAVIGSFRIASWIRPEGHKSRVTEADDLAVLNGGKNRLGEVVVSRMLARGVLKVEKTKLVRLSGAGEGMTENEVLRIGDMFSWNALRRVTDNAAIRIEESLQRRGLVMEAGERLQMMAFVAMPFVLLMGLGIAKVLVGMSRDRPVGFLLFFLAMTALVTVIRATAVDRRTTSGRDVCMDAREEHDRLSGSHTRDETGMAVALFGTSILATSTLGDFHRMRASGTGDSGSGGGGGSDSGGGDSGCGGGGCGGCGG